MTAPTRDARATELWRMCRASLVNIIGNNHPGRITAHPVSRWSKEELVADVLDSEFGEVTP